LDSNSTYVSVPEHRWWLERVIDSFENDDMTEINTFHNLNSHLDVNSDGSVDQLDLLLLAILLAEPEATDSVSRDISRNREANYFPDVNSDGYFSSIDVLVVNNHLGTDTAIGQNVKTSCSETSLFGGFNTFVNDLNFLEISNTTRSNVMVWVTVTNFKGEKVINGQLYTVAPGIRTDIDIHTPAGADSFGTIMLSHDAPSGGILARLSEYKITSAVPLEFSLAGNSELRGRGK